MHGKHAAIGFRDHTGWAIAVVLSGPVGSPKFIHRERMELIALELPRQVFHAVAEQGADRSLIADVSDAARRRTADELGRLLEQLSEQHIRVETAAIPAGTRGVPGSLDAILASHAMLHAAEGELYRDCLADAAASLGLRTTRFAPKELLSAAASVIGKSPDELQSRTSSMGRLIGPPWQKDHREAATAAWLGLAMRSVAN